MIKYLLDVKSTKWQGFFPVFRVTAHCEFTLPSISLNYFLFSSVLCIFFLHILYNTILLYSCHVLTKNRVRHMIYLFLKGNDIYAFIQSHLHCIIHYTFVSKYLRWIEPMTLALLVP